MNTLQIIRKSQLRKANQVKAIRASYIKPTEIVG